MTQQTIDGYTVIRRVIQTATSEIFLAYDARRREDVALKVVLAHLSRDRRTLRHYAREAQVSAGLDHPGLVRIYAFVTDTPRPYLLMKFIPGQTLKRAIYRDPDLVTARGFHWLIRAAEALGYLHRNGFAHLDVKPENLLVDQDGSATLIDLGLAHTIGSGSLLDSLRRLLTRRIFGTRSYLSPEQIERRPPGPMADVYGLGITMFEMFARRLPLTASDPDAILQLHLKTRPPMLHHVMPQVRPELSLLVSRMLEKDPDARPRSMELVIEELVRIGHPMIGGSGARAEAAS